MESRAEVSTIPCAQAIRALLDGGDRFSLPEIQQQLPEYDFTQISRALGDLTATKMYDTAGGKYGRRNK